MENCQVQDNDKLWPVMPRAVTASKGITLVEVVVGLMLLGTLLAWIIVSAGQLQKQQTLAMERLRAVKEIDLLTARFFRDGFPTLGASESVSYSNDFYWQLSGRPIDVGSERLLVATLSVHPRSDSRLRTTGGASVASLEVLVHVDSIGKGTK